MNIIIIIPSLQVGGAERVASILASEWLKNNKVKLLIFDKRDMAFSTKAEIIDLKLPALNGSFWKVIQFFRRSIFLSKFFKKENPDRIISFMESANFPSILAAFFSNSLDKIWITCHTEISSLTKIQILLIPYIYKHAEKVITVSKGLRDDLIEMGIVKEKIKVIYNPLSTAAPLMQKFLQRPIQAPQKYILGVGRLDYQKNFNILIDAFSEIKDQSLHLVILGEGEEKDNLLRLIKIKKLSGRAHLIGAVEDVWSWYRYAECFVSTSIFEPFGLVIIEAMSQGCPVVAFDCDYGPREIITHNIDGLLVGVNDVNSLTNIITTLLFDNSLNNKLRKNGLIRSSDFNAEDLSIAWLRNS